MAVCLVLASRLLELLHGGQSARLLSGDLQVELFGSCESESVSCLADMLWEWLLLQREGGKERESEEAALGEGRFVTWHTDTTICICSGHLQLNCVSLPRSSLHTDTHAHMQTDKIIRLPAHCNRPSKQKDWHTSIITFPVLFLFYFFIPGFQWFTYITKPTCYYWERFWNPSMLSDLRQEKRKRELNYKMANCSWTRFFFKKACVFHLPPLVLYLYPDGLEFGGWWRGLLFCHWLKAVNLINKKIQTKKKQTQKLAARIHIWRKEACTHTNTHTCTGHADTTHQKAAHFLFFLFRYGDGEREGNEAAGTINQANAILSKANFKAVAIHSRFLFSQGFLTE